MTAGEWIRGEDGSLRRATIHHMGRRCLAWDYFGTGTYLITLVLQDRSRPVFGRLDGHYGIDLTEFGRAVAEHIQRIGDFTPEVAVLASVVMPEHLHLVIQVRHRLQRHLSAELRGFKIGCFKLARSYGVLSAVDGGERRHKELLSQGALFADGFVDTILFDEDAVRKAVAYVKDNPRRLQLKLEHPELFRLQRGLEIALPPGVGTFLAIGNHWLLDRPSLVQVQCSRAWLAYSRTHGRIDRDENGAPKIKAMTEDFRTRRDELFAAARHGAVLVSPCVSDGERQIAREALAQGYSLVTMANKGFSRLQKPSGRHFDACAEGRLLMLAPAAWPYVPGEKPMTRLDACAMNRLCQWLCGPGAAEIKYHGVTPGDVDGLACTAAGVRVCASVDGRARKEGCGVL